MDTRYWGPSGWRLLHLISFSTTANKKNLNAFFWTIPYILPCKYCRKSFSENIEKDPIDYASSPAKWLWRMHNKVNAKLRSQHLLKGSPDPSFSAVEDIYRERLASGCSRTTFEGWEFLFSVAEAHPLSRQLRTSVPIQGHPAIETISDPLERNRWNVMEPEERLIYYTQFWTLLPTVLPFPEWTQHWQKASSMNTAMCRRECMKGLWAIRRHMEHELELLNRTSYNSLCKELQNHKSGCSTSARGKTCRKKRGSS
jgi:hypothetical protein